MKTIYKTFINRLLRRVESSPTVADCPYDDPLKSTCFSKNIKWFHEHIRIILFSLLVVTSITLAIFVTLLTWSYVAKAYQIDAPIITHKPNQMNLYTHDGETPTIVHKPSQVNYYSNDDIGLRYSQKSSGLDGDIADLVTIGEIERPFYKTELKEEANFEQRTNENAVSHNDIFHEGADDVLVENASPDEFRMFDQNFGQPHKKHYSPKYHEDNGEVHHKNDDFIEVRTPTVPVTDGIKEMFRKPPTNPKPTSKAKAANEKPMTNNADQRHINDASESPMTLYRVTNAVKAGAVCLDGSAPAYYHRPGSGNSEKLWIIHFNGGAWCFDGKACFERSLSSLGSTKKLPPSPPIIQGINSPDPTVNPDFYDWNLVWVVYCDGASFTGNRERPLISDSGETIYLRGKRVLNAIINDLLYNRDFKLAEAIILTGSSAGSMTAIFQADYIASKFPKTIPVRVLSDAGFFIDTAPIGGKNLGAMFKRIYELQNSSAGLNQDCVRDLGLEDAWQCFLPAKTMKYIKTPMFVLNSAYDIWALIYFVNIDCKFPTKDQKQRKKRNVDQRLFMQSDSELQVSMQAHEIDINMFRRDLGMSERKRRDISGFEMVPFFRRKSVRKDIIPIESTTLADETSKKDSTSNNNSLTDYNSLQVNQNHAPIIRTANKANSFSTTNNYNSTKSNPDFKKNHIKKFTNFLKDLGSITSDNDIDTLFQDMTSDVTYTNNTSLDSNQTTNENNTKITVNTTSPVNNTSPINTTSLNNDNFKKSHKNEPDRPTIKSFIPKFVDSKLGEIQGGLAHVARRKSVLQRLDELRQNVLSNRRKNTVLSRRHPAYERSNFTMAFKRQNMNSRKKDDALKRKRSTSIAKEYINILRSDPPECTEKEILSTMKYRAQILHATDNLMHMPKSGRFLVSCIDHSLSLFDETWNGLIVEGKSIQQAFGDWFYERGDKNKHNIVDCPYPCNPSCP